MMHPRACAVGLWRLEAVQQRTVADCGLSHLAAAGNVLHGLHTGPVACCRLHSCRRAELRIRELHSLTSIAAAGLGRCNMSALYLCAAAVPVEGVACACSTSGLWQWNCGRTANITSQH